MIQRELKFLRRKESLIFIILVFSIALFQLTMAFLHGNREDNPIFSLDLSTFEIFGIAIPFLILLWMLLKLEFPFQRLKPITMVLIAGILLLMVASTIANLGGPTYDDYDPLSILNTTTLIPITDTNTITDTFTFSSTETTTQRESRTPLLTSNFLNEINNILFIMFVLISAIIVLRTSRRQQVQDFEQPSSLQEERRVSRDFEGSLKNIIECYYQTSDSLEGKGADKSDHLTPKEFVDNVIMQKLVEEEDFRDLTELFTEAKFSEHDFSRDSVEKAKNLSRKIIFTGSKHEIDPLEEEE